ncbi:hypothetical protein M422DRAFT_212850 [Sphaerobolus stellatus SS14]|uniref:Protochlorophyllide reductase n=1 Tax=Sphaerobolus stellatus (strain SS14) TaxID=990650 RepID=A0A0C9V039_SPHS4|nr:hypothetical protein M422DRAFT_212850 [Sphaerobolus stellatus SS14]
MIKASPVTIDVRPLIMNLVDFKQVSSVAMQFMEEESRLDILVNNAAVLARPLDKTEEGISVSFATNHLGPFLFTTTLLPLVKKTALEHPGARIVNISSTSHELVPPGITLSSVHDFNAELGGTHDFKSNMTRYALSKLAGILFTKQLQLRFNQEGTQAVVLAVHPGGVITDGIMTLVGGKLDKKKEGMTPLEGATTPLFAATNPIIWGEKEKYEGQYLMPYGVVWETSENANNPALALDLWETSEKVLKDILGQ